MKLRAGQDKAGEVHACSDEISSAVIRDAMRAIISRIDAVDRSYDIPYVAGYSSDGRTVFIDRHMPRGFTSGNRRISR